MIVATLKREILELKRMSHLLPKSVNAELCMQVNAYICEMCVASGSEAHAESLATKLISHLVTLKVAIRAAVEAHRNQNTARRIFS